MANQQLLFYIVAALVLASAAGVVFLKNTVHSAFLLVFTFGSVALVYMMLNADFVAMAQLLVYAGAVVIMLLFALMLTQRRETVTIGGVNEARSFVAGITSLLLFVVYFRVVSASPWGTAPQGDPATAKTYSDSVISTIAQSPGGTTAVIGQEFFGTYLLPFEVASVLLLMALIGAIVLAKKDAA